MTIVRVLGAQKLEEGQTQTFSFKNDADHEKVVGRVREGFLLRHHGKLLAFENDCPHWSVELDLGDGHFYDADLDRVYCKNHGALFVLPSGACETGPCMGRSLTSFRVEIDTSDVNGEDALVHVEESAMLT